MLHRILIVDDNAAVRNQIRTHFESQLQFVICEEACDGLEALKRAEEWKPDLIVLDLSMPRMNGIEAAAALKKVLPNTPIILFTSYQDAVPESVLGFLGIRAVVSKTCQLGVLVKEVQRLIDVTRSTSA